ncbi:MAG: DNA polymerase III subunit delta [Desulfatiglandaceae bacterium]
MSGDLQPEYVLQQLDKGKLAPCYLFYGESDLRLERVLSRIREAFIPETARDFNLHIVYGDKTEPADIIDTARSLPFMSQKRLIIVRRTEAFSASALESFVPYLENPVDSTCLIFVASNANFTKKFYRKTRELGQSVHFKKLSDGQVMPWIKREAKRMGFDIEDQACAYLQQIIGSRLTDIQAELEKLHLRYGTLRIGLDEVREVAIHSRIYTIFELMDAISFKQRVESLSVLKRFLEEEDKDGPLRILGMLNRQIRILWRAKSLSSAGRRDSDVSRELRLPAFLASKVVKQSRRWDTDDFQRAVSLLYQADGLLKSGAQTHLVIENLVLSLCM